MSNQIEIKVYPLILEAGGPASSLWHLLRTLDEKGCGKITLTMLQLQTYMDCSKATVYRYLRSNLFQKVITHKTQGVKKYTLYYKSLKVLKEELYLEDIITSSFCFLEDIIKYQKKLTATEIIAESIQARSRYKAKTTKKKHQRLINIYMLFSEDNSICENTQRIKKNGHIIFYNADDYKPYGCSQRTIAKTLNKSRQTINKRLKRKEKIKQCFTSSSIHIDLMLQKFEDEENWTDKSSALYFSNNNNIYRKYCTLYKPEYVLKRKRL